MPNKALQRTLQAPYVILVGPLCLKISFTSCTLRSGNICLLSFVNKAYANNFHCSLAFWLMIAR